MVNVEKDITVFDAIDCKNLTFQCFHCITLAASTNEDEAILENEQLHLKTEANINLSMIGIQAALRTDQVHRVIAAFGVKLLNMQVYLYISNVLCFFNPHKCGKAAQCYKLNKTE